MSAKVQQLYAVRALYRDLMLSCTKDGAFGSANSYLATLIRLFADASNRKRERLATMHMKSLGLVYSLMLLTLSATAQTVTGSGTSGTIPVFTGSSTVGNSVISQSAGNIGIGTTAPQANINIVGTGNPTGYNALRFDSAWGPVSWGMTANTANTWGTTLWSWQPLADAGGSNGANLAFATGFGATVSPNSNIRMLIDAFGHVGIGTTTPAYVLDVTGQVHSSIGYVFPDGSTQTTAFIPANCGADYAESVGVSGDRTSYLPGDILVIDPDNPGKFLKSNQPYSTMVAGIYSTQPGFVGRLEPANSETAKTEVPMAMVGRVPTKVSAENGPIKVGDLLVSSSTMGYAMKGTDRSQMLGAVVGKALGSLDSGTGVIEVLVTLQ
jgi:hypothetical protein